MSLYNYLRGILSSPEPDGLMTAPRPQGLMGALTVNPLMARQVEAQRAANPRPDVTDLFGYGPNWTSYLQNMNRNLQAQLPRLEDSGSQMAEKGIGLASLLGPMAMTKATRALPMPDKLFPPPAPSRAVLDEAGRVERVPLHQVRATESPLERGKGRPDRGPLIEGYEDRPVAARMSDGTYLLYDGHRRTEAALNRGDGAVEMYVVDVKRYAPGADQRPSVGIDPDLLERLLKEP